MVQHPTGSPDDLVCPNKARMGGDRRDWGLDQAALIGAARLLFAHPKVAPPDADAVRRMVTSVIAGAVQEPPR
jgi:hypothetical protein